MQNQNLPLSKISRETYIVPKGEEQSVHYKAERVLYSGGVRVSRPSVIKTDVKAFDNIKRNLELQGYTIEILYHPLGKYTTTRIPGDAAEEIAERDAAIAKKDKEIAELEAKIKALEANASEAKMPKEEMPSENKEEKPEIPSENEGKSDEGNKKKVGRPKKEE